MVRNKFYVERIFFYEYCFKDFFKFIEVNGYINYRIIKIYIVIGFVDSMKSFEVIVVSEEMYKGVFIVNRVCEEKGLKLFDIVMIFIIKSYFGDKISFFLICVGLIDFFGRLFYWEGNFLKDV